MSGSPGQTVLVTLLSLPVCGEMNFWDENSMLCGRFSSVGKGPAMTKYRTERGQHKTCIIYSE